MGGAAADKASRLVAAAEPITLEAATARFASRGGHKLEAALTRFAVDPSGRVVLDAGASTGGFTDCLLQHGAARVYAVDVGHGQLDGRLRADPRVTVLDRVNVRTLTRDVLVAADAGFTECSLVVADLSFISLRTVLPALCGPIASRDADVIILVKPQFEAGRTVVARGRGVVRDPAVWLEVLTTVASALDQAGTGIMGAMASPLIGPAGNVEFLVHARRGMPAAAAGTVDAWLRAAVDQVTG